MKNLRLPITGTDRAELYITKYRQEKEHSDRLEVIIDTMREDDLRIMKLFRGRCVSCLSPATQIHELVTRARTKRAITMPQNRVPLCMSCHNRAHFDGYSGTKESMLRNMAIERLIQFDIRLEEW